ncbi:MAG: phosphomannomutase/phosphoglucomutase [Patescibacteria group bacterium]
MNPSIFKTYDIRGVVPEELGVEAIKKIAAALIKYLEPKSVVLGFDSRLSSPEFAAEAKEIFLDAGVDVFDLGMVPIEVVYFACGHLKVPGVMITASHNPREYNGIKIIDSEVLPVSMGYGLEKIKNIALSENGNMETQSKRGEIKKIDIWPDYLEKIFSFIDIKNIKPIKFVCDASNGVAGNVLTKITRGLPIKMTQINFVPDGDFPNHGPNPMLSKNRNQLIEECKKIDDLSFAAIFDGDADRIALLDENGDFVDTDYLSALISKILITKNGANTVVFDMRRGWAVKNQVESLGSKYLPSKSGYPFIREKMQKVNAIFGGEASAHNIYRDFFFADSSMITLLLIVEYLSENNIKLSEALEEYRESIFMFEETNFQVKDIDNVIRTLKNKFNDGKTNEEDGLSVEYNEWHLNLRPSATQPLVRLNLEGTDPELIEEKRDQVIKIIENNGGVIVDE